MRERKLFFEAIEIEDPARRAAFVDKACQGNPELLKRIQALLAAAGQLGSFLEPSGQAASPPDAKPTSPPSKKPAQPKRDAADEFPVSLDFLAPPSSSAYIGKLGHYDVIRMLGHGAFGIVFKAIDRRLHRKVAIKVLAPHLATTSPPRKRFLREARSCAAVQNPHVVHLYDVADKPIPFIAMELIEGQTLQDRIDAAGPFEISEVIEIAQQLASGLEAAHAAGLIHRDIKPDNILIEEKVTPRAVLTDFGLARAVDDASLTQSGVLTGTPNFMSPEQAQAHSLDYRTDLFSLGSVMYVMLTGRIPFRARTVVGVLQRVAQQTARPITELTPDCPAWLEELVNRLHAKSPGKRIQTAGEVREILQRHAMSPAANSEPPVPTVETPRPEAGKLPLWLIGTGIAAALLVVAWIVVALFPGSNPKVAANDQETNATEIFPAEITREDTLSSDSANANLPAKTMHAAHWRRLADDAPAPAITPFDAQQATKYQRQWADYLGVPVEFTDFLGIQYRLIPPGEFVMGTSAQGIQIKLEHAQVEEYWKECLLSEAPQHRVAITKAFYLATTEVTQNQYESIMSANPSYFSADGERQKETGTRSTYNFPVEGASWDDIQTFLNRLNVRRKMSGDLTGRHSYRLPSEAEWEFACRAGTQTEYWTGETIESLTDNENFNNNLGRIADVGSFRPNPFGLFDMSGNVHEYVQDRWDSRYEIAADGPITIDPVGPFDTNSTKRVARGGDYWWWGYHSRSAYRIYVEADERSVYTIGFRLACDVDAYPTISQKPKPPPSVSAYSEIHGAELNDLKSWLASLRGRFVPSQINRRWGSEPAQFDAVATDINDPGPWEVHFFDNDREAGQDFLKMRETHDIYWKLLFPAKDVPPLQGRGLKIWRTTDRDSLTWNFGTDNLQPAIDDSRLEGYLPMSLTYTESAGQQNSAVVQHYLPGVGNHGFMGLTPQQFEEKVAAYRERNWRPHFFQMQVGTDVAKLSCVFRDNLDNVAWEISNDLSEAAYEQQLIERRTAGWYPACVGSYVERDRPRYIVQWQRLAVTAPPSPIPTQERPRRGGFGGNR